MNTSRLCCTLTSITLMNVPLKEPRPEYTQIPQTLNHNIQQAIILTTRIQQTFVILHQHHQNNTNHYNMENLIIQIKFNLRVNSRHKKLILRI